jgi:hypothetical protein
MKREGESKGNDNNNKIIFGQMYYLPKHTENGRIKKDIQLIRAIIAAVEK